MWYTVFMKYAITDIGSNTVKVHFYTADENKNIKKLHSLSRPVKLIGYITDGRLSDEGITVLCKTLRDYYLQAQALECDAFHAFATASLRRASNANEVLARVKQTTGISIDLVSGQDEAKLSMAGVVREIGGRGAGLLIDMGGGSTEIIPFEGKSSSSLFSMHFGTLSLYNDFVSGDIPTVGERDAIRAHVRSCYPLCTENKGGALYISSGTGRAICSLIAHLDGTDAKGVKTHPAMRLFRLEDDLYASEHTAELIKSVAPERATTLMPGLTAICEILRISYSNTAVFVTAGARDGYLLSIL